MGMWDDLTGVKNPEHQSTKPRNQSRRGRARDTSVGTQPQSRGQKNVRPDGVSERVWGLTEQWLEMGEAHFGRSLPVNKQNFAVRLATKIRNDRTLAIWIHRSPAYWTRLGRWEDGFEFLNEVLAKMLDLFWGHLTEEQKNTSSIQFDFLDREWDEWVYQAVTSVQVAWLKEHSTWVAPEQPSGVFDRTTVGQPGDDEPCTDPEFPGMTWGEVRALREEDSRDLPALSDEEFLQDEQDEHQRRVESFARLKDAMLANRQTTTKENDR